MIDGDLFHPTIDDLIGAADREVQMRERVYPRWVADKRMTREKADRELALMRAIAAWLRLGKAAAEVRSEPEGHSYGR